MKKRIFTGFLVVVLAAAALLGCSSKETSADVDSGSNKKSTENTKTETTKVVLNEVAHSIFYAPMYVAIEEDYFAEEGIDLDLVTGFGVHRLSQKKPWIDSKAFTNDYSVNVFVIYPLFLVYLLLPDLLLVIVYVLQVVLKILVFSRPYPECFQEY